MAGSAEAATKANLVKKIQSQTKKDVWKTYYSDFDGDGEKELFALVGNIYGFSEEKDCAAQIWFASSRQVKKLKVVSTTPIGEGHIATISKRQKLFHAESMFQTGSLTNCYYVSSGKVYKVNMQHCGWLSQISGKDFEITHEAYDFDYSEGIGTGHTWKPYYIRWNGKRFIEYKAKKITKEKFRKYNGADNVLKQIQKTGYKVKTIYLRSNGLIHINVLKKHKGGASYENVTLRVKGKSVSVVSAYAEKGTILEISSYGGIYKAAGFKE